MIFPLNKSCGSWLFSWTPPFKLLPRRLKDRYRYASLPVSIFRGGTLIQTALIFNIFFCFVWGTVGIVLSPYSVVPILGFIALALSLGYSAVVWGSTPRSDAPCYYQTIILVSMY
jgi:hypothetical protein